MRPAIWIALLIILAYALVALGILAVHYYPGNTPQAAAPVPYSGNHSDRPVLATQVPVSPETAPVYALTGESAFFITWPNISAIKTTVPTEEEAPALAEKALEPYGGLPGDAVLMRTDRIAIKKYNTKTGTIEAEYPRYTEVRYGQEIAGHPVVGPGAGIRVDLGENGELLQVDKVWRSLTYSGEIPIISVEEAFEKLKKRELIRVPQCCIDSLVVSDIRLGYYAEDRDSGQEYYTPVWIFYGSIHPEIDPVLHPFIVDARRTP